MDEKRQAVPAGLRVQLHDKAVNYWRTPRLHISRRVGEFANYKINLGSFWTLVLKLDAEALETLENIVEDRMFEELDGFYCKPFNVKIGSAFFERCIPVHRGDPVDSEDLVPVAFAVLGPYDGDNVGELPPEAVEPRGGWIELVYEQA